MPYAWTSKLSVPGALIVKRPAASHSDAQVWDFSLRKVVRFLDTRVPCLVISTTDDRFDPQTLVFVDGVFGWLRGHLRHKSFRAL